MDLAVDRNGEEGHEEEGEERRVGGGEGEHAAEGEAVEMEEGKDEVQAEDVPPVRRKVWGEKMRKK